MPEPSAEFVPIVSMEFTPFHAWVRATFRLFAAQAFTWMGQGLLALLILGPFLLGEIVSGVLLARHPASLALRGLNLGAAFGLCVLTVPVMAGLTGTALKQLRGEAIATADFFRAGHAFLPLLGATLLCALGISLACACLCVPGVVLGGMLLPVAPLIVDRRAGGLRAIALAARLGRQNPALFSAYFVIWFALHLLGFACILGLVVTLPLMAIAQAVAYYDLYEGLPTYGGLGEPHPGPFTPPIPPYQPPPA